MYLRRRKSVKSKLESSKTQLPSGTFHLNMISINDAITSAEGKNNVIIVRN